MVARRVHVVIHLPQLVYVRIAIVGMLVLDLLVAQILSRCGDRRQLGLRPMPHRLLRRAMLPTRHWAIPNTDTHKAPIRQPEIRLHQEQSISRRCRRGVVAM